MNEDKEYNKLVGECLRKFTEDNFKLIKDFAAALNVHPSTIQSSYFNGRSLPGSKMLSKLLALGCDLNWLLSKESDLLIKGNQETYNNKVFPLTEYEKRLAEKDRLLSLL